MDHNRLAKKIGGTPLLALALGTSLAIAAPVSVLAQTQIRPPIKLLKKEEPATQPPRRAPDLPPAAIAAPPRSDEDKDEDEDEDEVNTGAVEVQSLRAIDVSSAGLIDDAEGGLGVDMWRGVARPLVERLLPQMPVATSSSAMRDLARRLLLTRARVPEGSATAPSLLGLRVERLSAAGDTESVNALMSLTPAGLSDRRVSRAKVDGYLLSGDTAGACSEFQTLVVDDPEETYWVKGVAFCRALSGAHEQAAFLADLLRDFGVEDSAFSAILRVLAGDRGRSVDSLLDPTPLHIAMMRTARLPVPADAIAGATPGILVAIARSPNAELDLRLAAAERAEAAGALDAGLLAEIYRSVTFALEELTDAPGALDRLTAPRANALLYQLAHIREVPEARAEALALAWRFARQRGSYPTAVRVNLGALKALNPSPELAWFAVDAVRALYTAGDLDGAQDWFDMARGNANPGNADAVLAVQRLWPLTYLRDARFGQGWEGIAVLGPWLEGAHALGATEEARTRHVDTVFTLLAAFDFDVPDEMWAAALQEPLAAPASMPSPGLWLLLRSASTAGQVGATALFVLLALGDAGPAGADPIVLAEIVPALRRVSLDDVARQIAVEAAMARMP